MIPVVAGERPPHRKPLDARRYQDAGIDPAPCSARPVRFWPQRQVPKFERFHFDIPGVEDRNERMNASAQVTPFSSGHNVVELIA